MSHHAIENKPEGVAAAPRPRKRRTVMSSEAIVAVAMNLFERQGFDLTSVDEIAAAAGVSKRTVFRHFASKNGIVLQPILAAFRTLPDMLAATPRSLGMAQAAALALETLTRAMEAEKGTIVRHTRMIATSAALRGAARALTDAALHDICGEVAARTGETRHSVRAAVWAELLLVAAFAARERWLSSRKEAVGVIIESSLVEILAFADLLRERVLPMWYIDME